MPERAFAWIWRVKVSRHNSSGASTLAQRTKLIEGMVVGHRDGYGFVIPDDKQGDLFLSVEEMRSILHGDRVAAYVSGIDRQGRRRGKVGVSCTSITGTPK